MAYDKVIDSAALDADLKSVADAIREKGGTSGTMIFPAGFINAISSMKTGGNMERYEVTFASDITGNGNTTACLKNNEFIKANYAKDTFFVVFRPKGSAAKIGYGALFVLHSNIQAVSGISASHGVSLLMNSGATAVNVAGVQGAVNGTTWNLGFRATSSGDLNLYTPTNRNVAAGTYEIYLICEE